VRKDYKDCVIHAVECEIISNNPDRVIVKIVGQHQDLEQDDAILEK